MSDPKVGTGKKPKGSGRRLYTDENPKDAVSIKFATPSDARATVKKVSNIRKSYARKMQILTVAEQRAKVMRKTAVVNILKKGKNSLRRKHGKLNGSGEQKVVNHQRRVQKRLVNDIYQRRRLSHYQQVNTQEQQEQNAKHYAKANSFPNNQSLLQEKQKRLDE